MFGLIAPTLGALLVGLLRGGSARQVIDARFRAWPLIALCFGLELALYNPPLDVQAWAMAAGPWIWLATRAAFLGVLMVNGWFARGACMRWAWSIAALGVLLNTLVVAANDGHMPQSPEAAVAVWGASRMDAQRLENVSVMGPRTRLALLGDVLPEPAWLPRRNVISIGDVLLSLGVAAWVYATMMHRMPKIGPGTATSSRWSRRSSALRSSEVKQSFASGR
jgi:hypothetical protein